MEAFSRMWEIPFSFVFLDFISTCGDSLFVIQKAKLLHMNTVVNIAPGGLYFHGKVIGMLVVFLGYKILILILVFLRVFWKVLCRNEILVFLGLLVFHIE